MPDVICLALFSIGSNPPKLTIDVIACGLNGPPEIVISVVPIIEKTESISV